MAFPGAVVDANRSNWSFNVFAVGDWAFKLIVVRLLFKTERGDSTFEQFVVQAVVGTKEGDLAFEGAVVDADGSNWAFNVFAVGDWAIKLFVVGVLNALFDLFELGTVDVLPFLLLRFCSSSLSSSTVDLDSFFCNKNKGELLG